jgi:hypothetical protein
MNDGAKPHRAVAHHGNRVASLDAGAHRGMVARAHDVRECDQRCHHLVRQPGLRDSDECRVRERRSHGFALASVDAVVPERSSADAVRRPSGAAVRASAIVERKGSNDEIALPDVADLLSRFLDDANELVTDRPESVR